MKLEEQVASLELSKRLKELGVKQESYFSWYEHREPRTKHQIEGPWITTTHYTGPEKCLGAAFSVAELGEMLPDDWLHTSRHGSCWYCPRRPKETEADTEANARATMLIYAIEKGIVKL